MVAIQATADAEDSTVLRNTREYRSIIVILVLTSFLERGNVNACGTLMFARRCSSIAMLTPDFRQLLQLIRFKDYCISQNMIIISNKMISKSSVNKIIVRLLNLSLALSNILFKNLRTFSMFTNAKNFYSKIKNICTSCKNFILKCD